MNAGPSPAGTNCAGESGADSRACRQWSLMAKYDTADWGVALANDRMYGRTVGAAPDAVFGGLNSSSKSDNRLTVNGWVKLDKTKIGAGVIRRNNDGLPARPDSDMWHLGVLHPVTPATGPVGPVGGPALPQCLCIQRQSDLGAGHLQLLQAHGGLCPGGVHQQ